MEIQSRYIDIINVKNTIISLLDLFQAPIQQLSAPPTQFNFPSPFSHQTIQQQQQQQQMQKPHHHQAYSLKSPPIQPHQPSLFGSVSTSSAGVSHTNNVYNVNAFPTSKPPPIAQPTMHATNIPPPNYHRTPRVTPRGMRLTIGEKKKY